MLKNNTDWKIALFLIFLTIPKAFKTFSAGYFQQFSFMFYLV